MKIVRATPDHLKGLAHLFDAYRQFYRQASDLEGSRAFLAERMQKQESVIFIALDEQGNYTGFTQLYPLFSSTRMRRVWLLNDLFVAADFRKQGVAHALLDAAKGLARQTNAAGVSLETERNNHPANNLYPTVGFELDEEHNFYFWLNE